MFRRAFAAIDCCVSSQNTGKPGGRVFAERPYRNGLLASISNLAGAPRDQTVLGITARLS
jgi:hypothetical protein